MIESALVFTLGALSAGLLALLVFPAFTRRAARLARRDAEARLPRSLAEIAAEKDAVRAEYAVRAAKVETEARALAEAIVAERLGREEEASQLAAARAEVHALMTSLREVEDRLFAAREDLRERDEALARVAAERRDLERRFTSAFDRARTAEGRLAQAERTLAAMQQTAWGRAQSPRASDRSWAEAGADGMEAGADPMPADRRRTGAGTADPAAGAPRSEDVVDVDYEEIRPPTAAPPVHAVRPVIHAEAPAVHAMAPPVHAATVSEPVRPAPAHAPAHAPAPPYPAAAEAEALAAAPLPVPVSGLGPVVQPTRIAASLGGPAADAETVVLSGGADLPPADWSGRIDEIAGRIQRFRTELGAREEPAAADPERSGA